MDKKAVVADWADVVWAVIVVIVTLFLFGTFTRSEATKIDIEVKEVDLQIERETILMNYLRTPVAETDFVTKNLTVPQKIKDQLDYAVKNKLTIADLFTLIDSDRRYTELIETITFNDKDFSKHEIVVDLSKISEYQKSLLLSHRRCTGKTSVAYIPVKNKQPIPVFIKLCS